MDFGRHLHSNSTKSDSSSPATTPKASDNKKKADKKKPEPPKKGASGGSNTLAATLAAKMAGKKWIGQRRTADVVAATKVECLVLGKREMQWAITHDEGIKAELQKDIQNRRVQTSAKLQYSKSMSKGKEKDTISEDDVAVRL